MSISYSSLGRDICMRIPLDDLSIRDKEDIARHIIIEFAETKTERSEQFLEGIMGFLVQRENQL